jgi:hypothetical protein
MNLFVGIFLWRKFLKFLPDGGWTNDDDGPSRFSFPLKKYVSTFKFPTNKLKDPIVIETVGTSLPNLSYNDIQSFRLP